jgi:hypothetical protein
LLICPKLFETLGYETGQVEKVAIAEDSDPPWLFFLPWAQPASPFETPPVPGWETC